MRTRKRAGRHGESSSGAGVSEEQEGAAGSSCGEGFLNAVSEDAVGRLLKRASSRKAPGSRGRPRPEIRDSTWETRDKMMELMVHDKKKADGDIVSGSSAIFGVRNEVMLMKEKHSKDIVQYDANEVDWEEGVVPAPKCGDGYTHEQGKDVVVEFTESPSSAQRRSFRRVSFEDKELAELVHKVHLLCLIARGRLIDNACNDLLIQASLLSLLPLNLLKIAEAPRLTVDVLEPLVNWFYESFQLKNQWTDRGSFKTNLAFALETREGTNEEIAALSVALFRALNLTTRFVSNLDVASLKPDADMPENSGTNATRLNTKIPSSITAASSPTQIHISHNIHLSDSIDSTNSHRLPDRRNDNYVSRSLAVTSTLRGENHELTSQESAENNVPCTINYDKGSKRKGDLEFELQLAMALAATKATKKDLDGNRLKDNSSLLSSSSKKLRIMKPRDSSFSSRGSSGAVWSRKNGPPLHWAEVYCVDEKLSRRWVHVDAANGLFDCEEKVEPASFICKKPLRYAVAFAGNGAKDVTRRYCRHWYRIMSQRISSHWWDTVLAPLKELESGETGGMVHLEEFHEASDVRRKSSEGSSQGCSEYVEPDSIVDLMQIGVSNNNHTPLKNTIISSRNSLEDMDLETRALTEPLPTNQLAYKNHNLYAIERWLTKHQTLHPKGPVVGYCSGHPVYPRSCVQTVQTRQKWLREGLQVRENEIPTKVIKCSRKMENDEISGTSFTVEDEEKATELFGKWQLEPLQLPHAVNGIVPKNVYGRVDAWSEKCLPHGTVHLRLPRLASVARRLGIDFANAMIGFEYRNGRNYPVLDGIVVCTEFRDAIMEAYEEEEERREAEEKRRNEADALSRWFQLLSSIITRQRLENSYASSSAINLLNDPRSNQRGCDGGQSFQVEALGGDDVRVNRPPSQDHEHVFSLDNQSMDEDGMIRVKRCSCGFSIQVEEL